MAMIRYPALAKGFPLGGVRSDWVVDADAEIPADAREGDTCYVKATGAMWARGASAWLAPAAGGPHAHAMGDVTGLQAALDAKADAGSGGGSDPFTVKCVSLSGVSTGANVTPINVPNCSFEFEANAVYQLFLSASTQAPATTTGSGFQIDTSVPVSVVNLAFVQQLANTGTLTGGSSVADDASVGVSSGRPAANVAAPVMGMGVLVAGATPGTAQLRYRSEVAAVSSVLPGCVLTVLRVA